MKIPIEKLKAIILYFCTYTEPRFLGKVKLMKLIYFLDFMHVKRYGSPVTFDDYVNLDHGPIPSTILNLVSEVSDDFDSSKLSDVISIEKVPESDMHRIKSTRNYTRDDNRYFSKTELATLEKVCQRFGNKNTKYIEDASHEEAPWKETKFLEPIPYTLAAKDKDCLVSEKEIKLITEI